MNVTRIMIISEIWKMILSITTYYKGSPAHPGSETEGVRVGFIINEGPKVLGYYKGLKAF